MSTKKLSILGGMLTLMLITLVSLAVDDTWRYLQNKNLEDANLWLTQQNNKLTTQNEGLQNNGTLGIHVALESIKQTVDMVNENKELRTSVKLYEGVLDLLVDSQCAQPATKPVKPPNSRDFTEGK